ncbi:hypothetical protein [Amycolatopsis sp. NPDC051128]|uniref:hypothetical protein n=1 Tax=Amycolatopsis sp. NPDC051128 TaxID=3155412 RepID=UPI00343448C8
MTPEAHASQDLTTVADRVFDLESLASPQRNRWELALTFNNPSVPWSEVVERAEPLIALQADVVLRAGGQHRQQQHVVDLAAVSSGTATVCRTAATDATTVNVSPSIPVFVTIQQLLTMVFGT